MHAVLRCSNLFSLLHNPYIVRSVVIREEPRVGALWNWYLHLLHFFKPGIKDFYYCSRSCCFNESFRSNDYSKNQAAAAQSPWKAILSNTMIVGRGYKLTQNSDKMIAPLAGCDSVSRICFISGWIRTYYLQLSLRCLRRLVLGRMIILPL